jgi:NADPH-dependent 2,4-dienoyl-CoA reductase/sulfur reductase-like enzyme
MTIEEIHFVVKCFGDAALRAKKAGYKLIEIHGAHGYLLTNFFSPHTNKRCDIYGGSLENRSRIYMEIYRDIRKKVGNDMAVIIRLSGTDYEPDGFPVEDTIALSKALEAEGIDAIHVSGGDHHTMIHQVSPMSMSVCHNTWAAELIKKELHIPVIASGSITLPQYAEDIIASGKGDFVGLGRPLWADPEWAIKAEQDRPEDIRPCIRCNEGCLERTFFNYQAITCAVNPLISREGELKIQPAAAKRKIAVVGAGAAGLEAARVLHLRGHDVTLFEAAKIKGGLLNEAAVPEFKADIRHLIQSLIVAVQKCGITVVDKKAEAADVQDFDAVVCATGSLPANPPIPGTDKKIAVNALDVLNDKVKLGTNIAVIGGGLVGSETALHLAENGKNVTLVEMLPAIMNDVAITDLLAYNERIAKTNMCIKTSTVLLEVLDDGVALKGPKGTETVKADNVILALGFVSEQGLYKELIAKGKEAYLVGDAVAPGKIMDAIHGGYRVGLKL